MSAIMKRNPRKLLVTDPIDPPGAQSARDGMTLVDRGRYRTRCGERIAVRAVNGHFEGTIQDFPYMGDSHIDSWDDHGHHQLCECSDIVVTELEYRRRSASMP